ncbi:MAG: HlyC/CorC family transporter [Firmicutes bacterium]|nr:HlyC/CorC family transporter [Bacillota bacterium]MBQ1888763.1 HlyC/CorC family transporter [Bacillota bacterium]MBQ3577428.1 HlyC/CorC family transporter [Bacillota bacterium]MBQ5437353.1 HlyC/CorC family transporter [Bacillota bacterium]MBQ6013827.1 HlyC/CorC family transporter [Bacillota bacterium]
MMQYIGIVILILLSAFFSGSEIAFASSSEMKLRKASEDRPTPVSRATYDIFSRYDDALISILIGNNLVNIGSSAVATVIAISLMGDSGAPVATAIMTVIIVIFGEITPKILASRAPEKFSAWVAIPLRFIMIVTFPVAWIVKKMLALLSGLWKGSATDDAVTEDDLETMLDTAEDEGIVDEDTHDLLQSALDFDDCLAYEIITPRVDMTAIDIDDDDETIKKVLLSCPFSRVPVYRDTPDHMLGFVLTTQCYKKMLDGDRLDLNELMMEPRFVHKTMPIPDVLELMKKTKCHLVFVTDEYGGIMGMLTMEDVMEQLVGEIWDEKDVIDEEFVELSDDEFEVDGDMRIYDFFMEMDMDDRDFEDDNATLGGWAIEMLGGYPKVGDSFDYKNLTLTVKEVEGLRVTSLLVKEHPLPEEEEE